MFQPLRTNRILIRGLRPADVAGLVARRNHPDAARYQNWDLPYPEERARKLVEEVVAMDGPRDDEWWMAAIADAADRVVFGDLALHLSWSGRTAEIGYTLHPDHWGNGYATEAAARLTEYLFEDMGVTRVFGMLHPDNVASARVLERCGLEFEGHTRSSYWVGDECSDDHIYGLTRDGWSVWRNRPTAPPVDVALVEITSANARTVLALETHPTQRRFVAPMAESFTDAMFPAAVDGAPMIPWLRAIEADGAVVGFVMVSMITDAHPEPWLWRLLIDRRHQRRRIGSLALDLVEHEVLTWGGRSLSTTWIEGVGSPRPFYVGRGYAETGEILEGETVARKPLA